MAKAGSGKKKMQAQRQKQQRRVQQSLKKAGFSSKKSSRKQGCYIATCVYGSYDCPQVWTLRRYRDNTLQNSWFGRRFITIYYAISPLLVRVFGNNKTITAHWQKRLDLFIEKLRGKGVEDTPYTDA